MIEPRLYRAAFLPALLALIVAAFSLEARPPPLPQALAADVLFQGRVAAAAAAQIAAANPDRRPGTPGDRAVAMQTAHTFAQSGFTTVVDHFTGGDGRQLVNVLGRRAGASRRQIVVIADRDASSVPDATSSAADTAALQEIAQVLQGTPSTKTIVLASVDGGTLGEVGVHRLLAKLPDVDKVEAVLVLSNLAVPGRGVPPLQGWSNDPRRVALSLERTAAASESEEFGRQPGSSSPPVQMIRLAFPLAIGAQGPLLDAGLNAVRFSGGGELPPAKSARGVGSIDPNRLGSLGRAVLRTLFAIDDSGHAPGNGAGAYVTVGSRLLPRWSVVLLGLALIAPALVASIDAFARARRRREPVARFTRWVLTVLLSLVAGLVVAKLVEVAGIVASPPASPVAPDLRPMHAGDLALLCVLAAFVVVVWFVVRRLRIAGDVRRLDLAAPGAGCAVALVLSGLAFATWLVNPYAALMLVPALHLWMLASIARVPDRGPLAPALVVVGLAPLAAVVAFYMVRLGFGPLGGLWYVFLLVTSGTIGIAASLLACAYAGVFACLIVLLVARARRTPAPKPETPQRPAVFGPGGYAGPGALGGTESALRR